MQTRLRVITLQGAIEKSPILLSQYWKFEYDCTIIISFFGGSNNIFADCKVYANTKYNNWSMPKPIEGYNSTMHTGPDSPLLSNNSTMHNGPDSTLLSNNSTMHIGPDSPLLSNNSTSHWFLVL